jgi:acyl-CoA dehydrogenase
MGRTSPRRRTHGGKGICLGPNNYLGRGCQVVPVAITVEGANLSPATIIFGQGRSAACPFVLREMTRRRTPTAAPEVEGSTALSGTSVSSSNAVRLIMALTHARHARRCRARPRYYQHV